MVYYSEKKNLNQKRKNALGGTQKESSTSFLLAFPVWSYEHHLILPATRMKKFQPQKLTQA